MKNQLMLLSLILLLLTLPLGPFYAEFSVKNTVKPPGTPNGQPLPDQSTPMLCADDAQKYFDCDDYYSYINSNGGHSLDDIYVVVVDTGISPTEWDALESMTNVDIVKYYTKINGVADDFGHEGVDNVVANPNQYNYYSNQCQTEPACHHGLYAVSTLASVAHGVKIIFFDYSRPSTWGDNGYNEEDIGEMNDIFQKIWELKAFGTYNIRIINLSIVWYQNIMYQSIADSLNDQDIIMFASSGNEGNQYNYIGTQKTNYPNEMDYIHTVGSIDHENRYDGGWGSRIHERSTFSSWGNYMVIYDEDDILANLQQSTELPGAVEFVMPGNGVPMISTDFEWVYGSGTSLSAPYLSGLTAVIIDGYADAKETSTSIRSYPTPSEVYTILSENTYLHYIILYMYLGWGIVKMYDAYLAAVRLGSPPPGDGWGE